MLKELVERKCELCKSTFEINIRSKSERILNKRFCSGLCAKRGNGLSNKGRKRTEEYKKNLSVRLKGEGNPFYGKKHTEETKNVISEKNCWKEEDYLVYIFTQEQKEIFDGIMISDGSLEKPGNFSSRMTLGFKYEETLERIMKDLNNMKYCPIYKYDYIEKRNGNNIINFFTKTHASTTLFNEYYRWYKDGVKIIPEDIKLTPLFCYWWYVMDGYISSTNTIILCTESFTIKDLEFIQILFNKIDIYPTINNRNRLLFSSQESKKFFNFISNIKIQKEYEYKFGN
jgi:hypothetical protein